MNINFDTAFDRLIGHEGGYVNDPRDPGGETNWGISKRSYPQLDIRNLTREAAKVIYLRDFWSVCSGIYESVLFQLFDGAVHHGIGNAVRIAQRAIGVVDDGHWGPHSKSMAATFSESDLLMRVLAERLEFMTKTQAWKTYAATGFAMRIAGNLRYAAQDNEV